MNNRVNILNMFALIFFWIKNYFCYICYIYFICILLKIFRIFLIVSINLVSLLGCSLPTQLHVLPTCLQPKVIILVSMDQDNFTRHLCGAICISNRYLGFCIRHSTYFLHEINDHCTEGGLNPIPFYFAIYSSVNYLQDDVYEVHKLSVV